MLKSYLPAASKPLKGFSINSLQTTACRSIFKPPMVKWSAGVICETNIDSSGLMASGNTVLSKESFVLSPVADLTTYLL